MCRMERNVFFSCGAFPEPQGTSAAPGVIFTAPPEHTPSDQALGECTEPIKELKGIGRNLNQDGFQPNCHKATPGSAFQWSF